MICLKKWKTGASIPVGLTACRLSGLRILFTLTRARAEVRQGELQSFSCLDFSWITGQRVSELTCLNSLTRNAKTRLPCGVWKSR